MKRTECVCVCVSLEVAAKGVGVPSGSHLRQQKMSTFLRLTEARSRRLLLAVGSEHHQREMPGVGAGTPDRRRDLSKGWNTAPGLMGEGLLLRNLAGSEGRKLYPDLLLTATRLRTIHSVLTGHSLL